MASKELVNRIKESAEGIQIGGNIPFEYMKETLETIQEVGSTGTRFRRRQRGFWKLMNISEGSEKFLRQFKDILLDIILI